MTRRPSLRLLGRFAPTLAGYGSHAASYAKKSLLGWLTSSGSADSDSIPYLQTLRARSRDLWMGSPLAVAALRARTTNSVGAGLRMVPSIDADALGLSPDAEDAWERQAEREWALWADSQHCDAAATCTFGELTFLALISSLLSGDVFAALPSVRRPGSIYDLRVHLLEADRICDPMPAPGLTTGRSIAGGVEVDLYGAPVAYYVAQRHPSALYASGTYLLQEWKRVPARGGRTGRRNLLHLFRVDRPEQRRGVPVLAPVVEHLKQLTRYSDAELMAAVVAGMLTVFIESEAPQAAGLGSGLDEDLRVDEGDPNSVELGNGSVIGLAPGEKVQAVNPGRPNAGYEPFVRAVMVQIGAAIGVPYEILVKHFDSSYTAARAAFVEFWKEIRVERSRVASRFCQPIYEEWLAEAVARGRIAAPGFFEDLAVRAAWSGAEWHGPAQGQINERVEVGAAADRVAAGFSTMAAETATLTGQSWDRVNRDRAREIQKAAQQPAGATPPEEP